MSEIASLPAVFEHKWSTICPQKYKVEFDGTVVKVTYQNLIRAFADWSKVYGLHEVNEIAFVPATKWINGSLLLKTGDPALFFELSRSDEMQALFSIISGAISDLGSNQPLKVKSQANESSLSDEITKLSNLHLRGLLSDEEFAAAKAKILGD